MRAWWSALLVPQNAANLRNRYAVSLENLAEPSQYVVSGPDFARISSSLLPIASIASDHETRTHCPSTSFSGYLRRRSPRTSSRTDAPFEQCEPRLIGLSQLGSWPIHNPFCTSAVTVQPTEQCVQMLLRRSTAVPGTGGGPASALRMAASGKVPRAVSAPAASPDRRRKDRRSISLERIAAGPVGAFRR